VIWPRSDLNALVSWVFENAVSLGRIEQAVRHSTDPTRRFRHNGGCDSDAPSPAVSELRSTFVRTARGGNQDGDAGNRDSEKRAADEVIQRRTRERFGQNGAETDDETDGNERVRRAVTHRHPPRSRDGMREPGNRTGKRIAGGTPRTRPTGDRGSYPLWQVPLRRTHWVEEVAGRPNLSAVSKPR
jgi:hypothetical protein